MRYCKFCKKSIHISDMTHWISNGSLKPSCKIQRADYRFRNRVQLRIKQNEFYSLHKRLTLTKEQIFLNIKTYLLNKKIKLNSTEYKNNKSDLQLECMECSYLWQANWNNLQSGSDCPECAKQKRASTNISKYGFPNPTQNSDIRIKAAKSANKITEINHWCTGTPIFCQGSYEVITVKYFNKFNIDFESQSKTFLLKDGNTYTPDFFLPKENLFIEVKGRFYDDAKVKFNKFCEEYNLPIEIWGKDKIKQLEKLCR